MTEQTFPEPPDGHALLWPARDGGELSVVILRDDRLAEDMGEPGKRWHTPNNVGASTTWAVACEIAASNDCPVSDAVLLVPKPEVERAVLAGGYETIGDHQVALGSGVCVTHGERYELPLELDRLRQREGGGGEAGRC